MHGDGPGSSGRAQVYGYRRRRRRWPWLVALVLVVGGILAAIVVPQWFAPEAPTASPQMIKRAGSLVRIGHIPNALWPHFDWSPDGSKLAVLAGGQTAFSFATVGPTTVGPPIASQVPPPLTPSPPPLSSVPSAAYGKVEVQLWDMSARMARRSVSVLYDGAGVLWSPDGKLIAVGTVSDTLSGLSPQGLPTDPNTVTLLDGTTGSISSQFSLAVPSGEQKQDQKGERYTYSKALLGWAGEHYLVVAAVLIASDPPPAGPPGPSVLYMHMRSMAAQVFDTQSGALLQSIVLSPDLDKVFIFHMRLSPDGKTLAVAYQDRTAQTGTPLISVGLWDVLSGKRIPAPPPFDADLTVAYTSSQDACVVAWSPDSSTLAVANGRSVRLLDVRSGKFTASLPPSIPATPTASTMPTATSLPPLAVPSVLGGLGPPGPVMTPVGVAPAQPVPVGPNINPPPIPNFFPMWGQAQGPPPTPTVNPNEYRPAKDLVWSPTGQMLAAYDARAVRLWNISAGTTSALIDLGSNSFFSVYMPPGWRKSYFMAFSPDAQMLAAVNTLAYGPYDVRLWDVATGAELRVLSPRMPALDWSPHGDVIALNSATNGGIELWGVR
jgi:WD40 repeat protein